MSAVLSQQPAAGADANAKLLFQKQLQAVTNKIHATSNVDEIMLELSQDICELFDADRLTIYSSSEDKSSIISKVKTGLNSFKDIKLPINEQSIAGFVALAQAHDQHPRRVRRARAEVATARSCNFLKEVDERTGYRTKQMLVAPIVDAQNQELIGVMQIINTKTGQPFPPVMEEGVGAARARRSRSRSAQRQRAACCVAGKYESLVTNAVLSAERARARAALGAPQEPGHRDRADRRVPGQAAGDRRGAGGVLRRAVRAVQAGPHQAARTC